MKLYPYLTPYTKINSKCIKDLNVRTKIIKLMEENIRKSFMTLDLAVVFLNMTPTLQATTKKRLNWTLSALKPL